jgi:conjugal transfer mating pair stabilization protein TraN
MLNNSGMCHYINSYCKKKWPLVGCVQEAEVFCCFNSKLARIIQEQGRPQLKSFNPNPWGVATDDGPGNADCRGFTSTEFQMLDFSKMDLSEYLGDITTQVQSAIQQNVSGKINSYYNSIQQQP